jgi:hypothetical protein
VSGKGEHPYRELGDDVRRRIQRLLDEIEPLHGFARLSWRYVPLGEMLDRAASILTALRHANLDIELLV